MQFNGISEHVCYYISGEDNGEYREWLRTGPDSWDVRMGLSWETEYDCEKLEALFQLHMGLRTEQEKESRNG